MTRETKIGLLVGMGVIILIGILISDHLSVAQRQQQAPVADFVPPLQSDQLPPSPFQSSPAIGAADLTPDEPLPLPENLRPQRTTQTANPQPPQPDILRQDLYPVVANGHAAASADDQDDEYSSPHARRSGPIAGDEPLLPPELEIVPGPGPESFDTSRLVARANEPRNDAPQSARQAPPQPQYRVHFVEDGETLYSISMKYYGNANHIDEIFEANRNAVPRPNLIRPGVRLRIPNQPGQPLAAESTSTDTASNRADAAAGRRAADQPPAGYKDYTVKTDDSLSKIAEKFYGTQNAWPKLYELNKDRISNPNVLKPGTVIRVPKTRPSTA